MALVCVAMVVPLAGVLFIAQAGTAGGTGPGAAGGAGAGSGTGTLAVVKLVVFVVLQPVAAPPVFFGTTNQLYKEAAVNPVIS